MNVEEGGETIGFRERESEQTLRLVEENAPEGFRYLIERFFRVTGEIDED